VLSPEEIKRVLTVAASLKARAMLSLAYGSGLGASAVARLRACDIDSEQMIIRVVQSKGRKDRNVMLPAENLDLLRIGQGLSGARTRCKLLPSSDESYRATLARSIGIITY
jgi:integrase